MGSWLEAKRFGLWGMKLFISMMMMMMIMIDGIVFYCGEVALNGRFGMVFNCACFLRWDGLWADGGWPLCGG